MTSRAARQVKRATENPSPNFEPCYPPRTPEQQGFTYIGLLITVAILAVASAASVQLGSLLQRRAEEEELLAIGMEFRMALISYGNATPPGQSRSPSTLQDLLKDPRTPHPRRHLRKIYADPITGKEEWGVVQAIDGSNGIAGIYSLADDRPIKIGNFANPFLDFENRKSYREWKFTVLPLIRPS